MFDPGRHLWVFVSHARADLPRVRQVRNYLEDHGASPILFHLLSLKKPEQFWPLIQSEIAERNFFLYCESEAAEKSEWVRLERAEVAEARKSRSIRLGRIRVDGPEINTHQLEQFLRGTRVFPSYAQRDHLRVFPFLDAMKDKGFQVFDHQENDLGSDFHADIQGRIVETARDGWIVLFLSSSSLASGWVQSELKLAQSLDARLVPVLLEPVPMPPELSMLRAFDATWDDRHAPQRLADFLLGKE